MVLLSHSHSLSFSRPFATTKHVFICQFTVFSLLPHVLKHRSLLLRLPKKIFLSFDKPLTYSNILNLLTKYSMQWLSDAICLTKPKMKNSWFRSHSLYQQYIHAAWNSFEDWKRGSEEKKSFNLIFSFSRILLLFAILRDFFLSFGARFFFLFLHLFNRLPDKSKNGERRKKKITTNLE